MSEIDEPRIRTPQSRAHAHSSFDLLFSIHGGNQDVKLTLHPNQDLIPDEGIKVDIVDETGKVLRTRTVQKNTHRIYKGESWLRDEQGWYHAGWARIVLFKDGARPEFEGAFSIAHDAHHIQLRSTYLKTKHAQDPEVRMDGDDFMVVWKDSDIKRDSDDDFAGGELRKRSTPEQGRLCPSDNLSFNAHPDHPLNSRFLEPMPRTLWGTNIFGGSTYGRGITKRQTIDDDHGGGFSVVSNPLLTIGSTDGCPRTRQIALIGIATDCTYTAEFDDEAQLEKNVVNILNTA